MAKHSNTAGLTRLNIILAAVIVVLLVLLIVVSGQKRRSREESSHEEAVASREEVSQEESVEESIPESRTESVPEANSQEESSEAAESSVEEVSEASEEESHGPDPTDWRLILVNGRHPLPEDFEPGEMVDIGDNEVLDVRAAEHYFEMRAAIEQAGYSLYVDSAYRSRERQASFWEARIRENIDKGLTREEAEREAASWVAPPGYSEHETGLTLDISTGDPEGRFREEVRAWLREHCAEYGFILRYPEGKEDITGAAFEPWHFRYVGEEAAREIMDNGLTLEEYLGDVLEE